MSSELPPTKEALTAATSEGASAAEMGRHFKTDCPYTYDKFPGMSYVEFDRYKRPLMNAWFDGWKAKYRKPT